MSLWDTLNHEKVQGRWGDGDMILRLTLRHGYAGAKSDRIACLIWS